MEKVEFSQLGFKHLESQLYALDNNALTVEAQAVLSDYINWVNNHVILTTQQVSYLQDLDPLFIASLASNAAVAFINRLPLNLVLPDDYSAVKAGDGRGKWFLDSSTIVASGLPGEPVTATGELIYEFRYTD